jgi:hypothetical protein
MEILLISGACFALYAELGFVSKTLGIGSEE